MSSGTNNSPNGGAVNAPPSGFGAPAPLTPSENVDEFQAFLAQYKEEFQPRGVIEQAMVYQLASTAWRLRRLPFLESILVGSLFQGGTVWKELDLLSRHETRLTKNFSLTLHEIQTRRKAPSPQPEQPKVRPAAPAAKTEPAPAQTFASASGSASPAQPSQTGAHTAPPPLSAEPSPPA
jgi:hypothetical protein